jgi:hypothetical protein
MSDQGSTPPVQSSATSSEGAQGGGTSRGNQSVVDPNARHQARAALVTAIVALVSAILGPLISLWINSDQIDSQREQFSLEAKANTRQSEGEFVRTQRSAAYTEFLSAFNNGTLDLLGAAGIFGGSEPRPQDLGDQEQKGLDALKEVTATYYQVRIVASQDANESAQALYNEFATWSGALLTIGAKVIHGQPLTAEEKQVLNGTSEEYATLVDLSNRFIETGRDDFNVDKADETDTTS